MTYKVPIITLTVLIVSIVAYSIPTLQNLLIYDREAILGGELWRLLTAHFVHFSTEHLFYNLLCFAIVGSLIEIRGYRFFGGHSLIMTLFISITLLIAKPEMIYYGGLSGIVCGFFVYFTLTELQNSDPQRVIICALVLLLIIIKLVFESLKGQFWFVANNELFVPVPISHIAGSLVALIFFLIHKERKIINVP